MSATREALKRMRLFDGMTDEQVALLEKLVFVNRVNAGDAVCREGDSSDFVCFVVRGQLNVVKHNAEGQDVILTYLRAGDSMGEMALIDQQPRSASAVAFEDSTLVVLTRKGFEQLRKRDPEMAIKVLENMARLLSNNLRNTSAQLAQLMLPLA